MKLIGLGSYVPKRVVSNDELSKYVETSDEWIVTRTGIKERRLSEGENTSDLGSIAAKRAIEMANISPEDIDLIIVSTVTPDYFTPSTACVIQKNIGAKNAACFDLNAGCTGLIYGLVTAEAMLKTLNYRYALIVGAETLSKIVDWKDRNTCVLFGDGASACVVEASEDGVLSMYLSSEGEKGKYLECNGLPLNNILIQNAWDSFVRMDGREVFKFATNAIVKCIDILLKKANLEKKDIAYVVPHQANIRIIDYAADKTGIGKEKFYVNIDKYGNTSSASIGIALCEMHEKGMLKKDDKVVLVGFGGGLTSGGLIINWSI
ncbi:beta-ketoacyl-ACP synthase III [Thermobrachium celere]|uniref:Beta-ketoacyl-[acyl-carrier-protein] synthase III n=1 Tax=Thermobrachium celere DSM 8682 TaxID=941824 RepID=R7RTU4_9CLOT|nr:beta-ketoacyl-ACP synthase III [Thermobrachium celere]CDF58831.1 3-oxoacyl-[acyl-carrier-protein] synthase, KASIII [Thermobrachium celere DSM 8682]